MPTGTYVRKPWTQERKRARSLAYMGHPVSGSFRTKTSARMKERPNLNFEGSQRGIKWTESRRLEYSIRQKGQKRKPHSIESRRLMSQIARKNRPSKAIDESKAARSRFEYKIWRQAVYLRDDYKCLKCQHRGGILHPHHIVNFASCPELRYDVTNGAALCINCHKLFHKLFGKKANDRLQFDDFVSEQNQFRNLLLEKTA